MKKFNIIMIIFLSIIPEVILWIYLQDVLDKWFLDTILFIYAIIIALGILRYIISEISFRLFIKKSMIDYTYNILVNNKFPNPWNYYIDDWISYFDEVWRDINNELLETNIINLATIIYSETKSLYDQNNFWQYWRVKNCLKIAVKKYMDEYFENGSYNIVFSKDNLLKIFKNNNFPSSKDIEFSDPLEYLDKVIENTDNYLISKIYACKLRCLIWKISSDIIRNEYEYWLDETTSKNTLNKHIKELWIAIDIYSKEWTIFSEKNEKFIKDIMNI